MLSCCSVYVLIILSVFFFIDTSTTETYTLSLHDALPIFFDFLEHGFQPVFKLAAILGAGQHGSQVETHETRSEEHTSELQSLTNLVCRLLLEKKKKTIPDILLSETSDYLDRTLMAQSEVA